MHWLASDNGQAVYIGIFFMLLLGGIGFPIPEDIPLLMGGAAALHGIVDLRMVFIICYVGVMIGDQSMYLIGHFFGHRILNAGKRSALFPGITAERIEEVREGLRKRRFIYILLGRHLFPVRSLTFVMAGALRLPFLEFLIADAIAALLSVTLMVGLGYLLAETISPDTVSNVANQAHVMIIAAVVVFAVIFVAQRFLRVDRNGK